VAGGRIKRQFRSGGAAVLLDPVAEMRALLAEDEVDDDEAALLRRPMRQYVEDVPEPGVGELRFADFPMQAAWYSEEVANAEEVVIVKSAQVGASAYSWRWSVRQADQFGDTGVYIFPTDTHVKVFGDERIEPSIQESPYLQSRILKGYVQTKSLKRIGRGVLHLRGSNSKAGAQSVAAQFLVFDEYDLLDQVNLKQIERRISGARQIGKKPRIRRLGYPLIPNSGIDAAWRSSDQRVWHVTCTGCGDEQPVSWEENVRWTMPGSDEVFRPGHDEFEDRKEVGRVWRQCRSCEASLEDSAPGLRDGALRKGRWIAKHPERAIIGFHAWRGQIPTTDLPSLVIASRDTTEAGKEAFYTLDLGRVYSVGTASLDEALILRASSFGQRKVYAYHGANPVTMGVDIAGERALNVRVSEQLPAERPGVPNPRRALWIGTVESFEEVARMMEVFRVWIAAVDSNPERRFAKLLRATYPGRVVLVEYGTEPQRDEPIKLTLDDAGVPLKARVNRTDAIDSMMDSIRQLRNYPTVDFPGGYMAQMKALHRRTELDKKGRPFRHYVTTGTEGDDYAHAEVFDLVATELWRSQGAAMGRIGESSGRPLPDEEFGFDRVRLGADDADQWRPGLGGE
jgi:hypothetical protein